MDWTQSTASNDSETMGQSSLVTELSIIIMITAQQLCFVTTIAITDHSLCSIIPLNQEFTVCCKTFCTRNNHH